MTGVGWSQNWRDSRPIRRLILGGVAVALIVCWATAFLVAETRAKEITDAKRELSTLDLSLTEQTDRAVQGVDLVLQSIIDQMKSEGIGTAADFERQEAGAETSRLLRARASEVPQLNAVALIATDGRLINFSRYLPIPDINVADRDYFRALHDDSTVQPFLSAPVQNRGNGDWTLYVARRINDASGNLIGLVLGGIDLSYFENLYRGLSLGPGSGISLWRRDGTLLARYPSIDGIGRNFQIKSFTEALQHGSAGVYDIAESIDGFSRIVATRSLRNYPLVVNVTRTLDVVLADWRRVAVIIGVAGALVITAAALVVWALVRQFGAYESLGRALAETAEAVLARKAAEDQLHQARKLEAIGKLTAGVAHDFNNLLTPIVGNLEFLSRDLQGARMERRIQAIQNAVDRAATLTGQLLAFARKQHLFPDTVALNQLIENLAEMLRTTLGSTIRIELALCENPWPAVVDPVQIELVLLNLAINARDAMPQGGVLTIRTDNVRMGTASKGDDPSGDQSDQEYVEVTVADTGTGMTEEVLSQAFDPFFTTKPPGQGTGLGLSQAYGTVQQSGGSIDIASTPGKGTVVRIYLPRSQAPAVPAPATVRPPAAQDSVRRSGKVLVVDDDDSVRETVSEMVHELGFTVIEAGGGLQALDLLAGDRGIALVVMDFAMPELNGAEVARRARRIRPDLPVIFVTGYAEVESLKGESWVLQKPLRQEALASKLQLALSLA